MRRNLSGIFIMDTLEGDEKEQTTCIEDCTKETRIKWIESLDKGALERTVEMLAVSLRTIGDEFDIIVE